MPSDCVSNWVSKGICTCDICETYGNTFDAVWGNSVPRSLDDWADFIVISTGLPLGVVKTNIGFLVENGVLVNATESGLYQSV